ncbi:uncharacterized protein BX663DRAFT_500360 [Cokeromyces recurvatus]|uniref:uncharacterized protein n=1 Tax=Cokeromyces recurvatus TaxID=90255 RepID=UPI00221F1BA2|nr:uncharacterized protein BX663DRAFT_500360 [Cokeromyces recurvatus]KAI7905617.1 hypothetical protein BX663DRAFT_500360 [Cokeromyces recurvatus]
MFWKKKDKKEEPTNPFESSSQPSSPAPSYHSRTANPSYDKNSGYGHLNDSEGQRNQLLSGRNNEYNHRQQDDRQRNNLYDEEDEEDMEVTGMKQQIKNVKQDSLASTRLALQKIHETEATAANTMNMLGQQSSQIANINRHLDLSKAYSDRASNQAEELKQLNRSIFIPVVSNPFRRKEKERKQLAALQRDQAEHMTERDNIRQFEYESNARIQEAVRQNQQTTHRGPRGRSEADRRRYQFEEDSEDDAIEDEIDTNLDLLGDATSRLKNMAVTMNNELDRQNSELNKTVTKVDPLTHKLIATTNKLNRTN